MESGAEPLSNDLRDRFPVLHLLDGMRIALQFPQLLLATAAVLILGLGQWAIDRLPFAPRVENSAWAWEEPLVTTTDGSSAAASCVRLLAAPYRSVAEPAVGLLRLQNSWSSAAYFWTRLLWGVTVWAFFGAAISRVAAVSFAVDRTIGPVTAAKFAGRRFLSLLTAPLLPVGGLLVLWLLLTVGGWIGEIPQAGPVIVGVFWFLALAVGFVAALIVVGLFTSWPLMAPTISTEDSDAFDGFSRSFGYVFSRPRQWIGVFLASVIYGTVCVAVVLGLALLVVHLAVWGVSSGMNARDLSAMTADSPFPVFFESNPDNEATTSSAAVSLTQFWLSAASLLIHGFAASLFWTLATIGYFLLRKSDDATALDEVFLTEEDEPDDLLPLVGVAGSEQPVIERPLEKDPGGSSDGEETKQQREPERAEDE